MMHDHGDLFIGVVATLIGTGMIVVAATNCPWYYSLRSARFLESRFSRTGARVLHAFLGLALLAMGVALLAGLRWQLWD